MSFGMRMGLGLGGGARRVFTPKLISGLKMWLDGTKGLTTRDDAGTLYVTAWADQSGNGIDVAQSILAAQPLLLSGGGARFAGGVDDEWLASYCDRSKLRFLHQEHTVFFALKRRGEGGGQDYIYSTHDHSASTNAGNNLRTSTSTPTSLIMQNSNGTDYVYSPIANNTGFNLNTDYVVTEWADADSAVVRLNGTPGQAGVRVEAYAVGDPSHNLTIGSTTYGGDGIDIDLYEVVGYDRALTSAEILKVEAYLSKRWGIS